MLVYSAHVPLAHRTSTAAGLGGGSSGHGRLAVLVSVRRDSRGGRLRDEADQNRAELAALPRGQRRRGSGDLAGQLKIGLT
jgi:hypothetical protein